MRGRLYKRKNTWWCGSTTKKGAGLRAQRDVRSEGRRICPACEGAPCRESVGYAENQATVEQALERLLIDRGNKGRSEATLSMYRQKAGHIVRLLGAETP